MKVLIVEDEVDLANALQKALKEASFSVDVAHDGESGLFSAERVEYDLVVLDLMLPRIDGWDVLRQLRVKKRTPVLILTARDAVADKVRGLNTGADDYLTKPFSLDEFLARVRSLIRRAAGKPSPVLASGDVEINTAARTVKKAGKVVDLTAKEYALAEFLLMHHGELITRTMLYDHIYCESDDTLSNVVDVHIVHLRKKLGQDFVATRRGQGYIVRG